MSDVTKPGDRHYSDEGAREILRRATEIEKDGHVSETRLREIAQEAAIHPDAINMALAEAAADKPAVQQTNVVSTPAVPDARPRWQKWVIVIAMLTFIALVVAM